MVDYLYTQTDHLSRRATHARVSSSSGLQIILVLGRTNVWPSLKLVGHQSSMFPGQWTKENFSFLKKISFSFFKKISFSFFKKISTMYFFAWSC
jgi:hypothetical protein